MNYYLLVMLFMAVSCTGPIQTKTAVSGNNEQAEITAHDTADTTYMATGFYFLSTDKASIKKRLRGTNNVYSLAPIPFASVKNVSKTKIEKTRLNDDVYTELCMTFDEQGTNDLKEWTGNPLQPKIAVIIANKLLFVAQNRDNIRTGIMCVGLVDFSVSEIESMQKDIANKR